MTITSEYNVFDEVWFLYKSDIVKGSIREVIFPHQTKWNNDSTVVQYGVLTDEQVRFYEDGGLFENTEAYIHISPNKMDKTVKGLLNKLEKEYVINNK